MKHNTAVKEKEEIKAPVSTKRERYSAYPFLPLQRDMNQLFEDFSRGLGMWRPRIAETFFGDFHAKVELKDNDNELIVSAELPGVDMKDIELTLSPDSLTIKGEKREEVEEKEKGFYHCERNYGYFQRVLPLPCQIDKDSVEATFKNGVLKVVILKSKESIKDTKKVEIKNN